MKIVIDIPEQLIELAQKELIMGGDMPTIANAINNGLVLPKGHGRIADIDRVLEEMKVTRTYDIPFVLERVKPIIEADKGE